MMTWHVVPALLPPQACSSATSKFLATSRNDSGLPWCVYGSWPVSNSTVVDSPSMMNVPFGICPGAGAKTVCVRTCGPASYLSDVLAQQRRVDGAVHHDLGQ